MAALWGGHLMTNPPPAAQSGSPAVSLAGVLNKSSLVRSKKGNLGGYRDLSSPVPRQVAESMTNMSRSMPSWCRTITGTPQKSKNAPANQPDGSQAPPPMLSRGLSRRLAVPAPPGTPLPEPGMALERKTHRWAGPSAPCGPIFDASGWPAPAGG